MTSAAGAKYIKARASQTCYTTHMALFYTDTSPTMEALQVQLLRVAPHLAKNANAGWIERFCQEPGSYQAAPALPPRQCGGAEPPAGRLK